MKTLPQGVANRPALKVRFKVFVQLFDVGGAHGCSFGPFGVQRFILLWCTNELYVCQFTGVVTGRAAEDERVRQQTVGRLRRVGAISLVARGSGRMCLQTVTR